MDPFDHSLRSCTMFSTNVRFTVHSNDPGSWARVPASSAVPLGESGGWKWKSVNWAVGKQKFISCLGNSIRLISPPFGAQQKPAWADAARGWKSWNDFPWNGWTGQEGGFRREGLRYLLFSKSVAPLYSFLITILPLSMSPNSVGASRVHLLLIHLF